MAINVLFWTNSANYPGVDGMLWLADTKTLVLLQITLSSVQGHESNFWVGDDSRTHCGGTDLMHTKSKSSC